VLVAVLRPQLVGLLGDRVLDHSGGAGLDLLPPHLRKGSGRSLPAEEQSPPAEVLSDTLVEDACRDMS
jgi:hypothetical protein